MGKKTRAYWSDVDGGYAFIIPVTLLKHPNFIRLSPYGVKLVMDLGRQYSGFNNGYLCPAWTALKPMGWRSRTTIAKAVAECEHYRIIVRTKQGGRNAANLYALTWWRINEKPNRRIDAAPSFEPSHDWKEEQPKFQPAKKTLPCPQRGQGKPVRRASRG
jgi:hypothetical protein